MNKEERNTGSIIIFIIILLVIAFGGYYLVTNLKTKEKEKSNDTPVEVKSIKKEEDKDFVYFTNEVVLSVENDLKYKDIVININSDDASKVQAKLNEDMARIKSSVTKISESNIEVDNPLVEDDIYEAEMIDYDIAETSNYLSITVNDYIYKVDTEATNNKLTYYVFDLSTGKLLTNRDILNKEGKTDQDVRTKIREYISNDEEVDIDATLNQDYSLSISKTGKIIINTVVKTNVLDYNVSIEMD